jgi:hypothetical protein
MLLDASAFISYKQVTNLSVRMGNNPFVPVLGRGTTVFSLNGKRVLVRNTLHVPGLAIPIYSLRAHLYQPGCGFIRTFEDGFHVYFPSFVFSVDMSSDCYLTFNSLGTSAFATLHFVQPRCPAKLYPSETLTSSLASAPHPEIIKDDEAGTVADVSVGVASDARPSSPPTVPSDMMPPASPTTTPPASQLPPRPWILARFLVGSIPSLAWLCAFYHLTPTGTQPVLLRLSSLITARMFLPATSLIRARMFLPAKSLPRCLILLGSSPLCHKTMFFGLYITRAQFYLRFAHVIPPTPPTRRPTGQPKNCTARWDAGNSKTTSIFS